MFELDTLSTLSPYFTLVLLLSQAGPVCLLTEEIYDSGTGGGVTGRGCLRLC